ncbi:MAG: Proline--tRNA ligase [Alphaproteobacteria bacterium MarineAlpha5_Bin11]|nr:proline--tRNA ligase [Pelagibacteraceae bacterium]PPR42922.1 MAG: Proline--tRNA ligase [Alphaproteobacteria bacterium MarineAlpha5_Bin11]|tara:strand:- start:118203 stop:119510 length:1308 start_codon:yes stop_codon:yes gene_type:complete
MKYSLYFAPTSKDVPSEAEIISHKLMIRSGMIKQSSAGIYSWLPLGFNVLKKIEHIVRKEQEKAGAVELLMPTMQSADLWIKSGRYDDYGKEMLRIQDRSSRQMLYGPTNEELITEIFRSYINSYKDLPKNLFHIQWKFRDELRPRFGVMRGREFLMKDNYSFDLTFEEAKKSYNNMYRCYLKTFLKLGLTPIVLRAESGAIGGNLSHEFQILAKTGESTLYYDKELENIDPSKANIEKLQDYYAAVDDQHNPSECPINEKQLKISKGIEVGHIFYFGTKYSEKLSALVQTSDGKNVPVEMGSYGIGVSRLVGAIIEAFHDSKGIIWPDQVAPFYVSILNLNTKDLKCNQESEKMYSNLCNINIETLYDDRDIAAGSKFSDHDLIGIPYKIIIGPRDIKEGRVEIENRKTGKKNKLSIEEALNYIIKKSKDSQKL